MSSRVVNEVPADQAPGEIIDDRWTHSGEAAEPEVPTAYADCVKARGSQHLPELRGSENPDERLSVGGRKLDPCQALSYRFSARRTAHQAPGHQLSVEERIAGVE